MQACKWPNKVDKMNFITLSFAINTQSQLASGTRYLSIYLMSYVICSPLYGIQIEFISSYFMFLSTPSFICNWNIN